MNQVFGCARCRVPLLIIDEEPCRDDIMRCPVCGLIENAEIISRELAAYTAEEASRSVADAMQSLLSGGQPVARSPTWRSLTSFRFVPLPRGG